MTWRGRADLQTNLTAVAGSGGIDMSNVTAYSTRPKVLIDGKDASDSGGDYASGTLDLEREIYQSTRVNQTFRNERYVIPATYKLVDQSSETNAKEVLEEIDRVLYTYNLDQTHEYQYEMDYEVTTDRGEILATVSFVLIKNYVDVSS